MNRLPADPRRLFLLLSLSLLPACGAPNLTKRDRLEERLLYFHTHLRAGDWERAASYVAPEGLESFEALHDPSRNVMQMQDFTVMSVVEDPKTSRAAVLVSVHAIRQNTTIVRTVRYRQVWKEIDGEWMMIAEELLVPAKPAEPPRRVPGTLSPSPEGF